MDRSAPVLSVLMFAPTAPGVRLDVTEDVTSFTFEDTESVADKVELDVNNFDLAKFDDPLWKTGNLMEVTWGYLSARSPTQQVIITKITGSIMLKIEALSKSILMNKKPRSQLFEKVKRSDVARQIAAANGYGPDEQIIEDTVGILPHVMQAKLTDAQFMKDLARREGFQFWIGSDGFHFHRRKMGKPPVKTLVYYTDLTGSITSFNVENDVTVKPGVVKAVGRDALQKKDINEQGSNADTTRATLAPVIEIVDPVSGVTSKQPLAAEATMLTNAADAAGAKREADGKFIKAQQTTAILSVNGPGDPELTAKQVVELQNISKRLSGRYYITKITHSISADGYTIAFTCRTDGTNGMQGATGSNVKSDGTLNTKDPKDAGSLYEKVDPRTGVTQYTDADPNPKGET